MATEQLYQLPDSNQTPASKPDDLYLLPLQENSLNETDVRAIVGESFNNFDDIMKVQKGFLQSGNFVTGSAGWQLTAAGNFEGNSGTFRGTLSAVAGGNTVTLAPGNTTAILAGPTGAPTFTVTQAGVMTATGAVINGYVLSSKGVFGGDGSDGALAISSGTTTIDCANAAVVIKNYTSISITGTGALAFSNPSSTGTIIILKSQGAVVLTSTAARGIDLRLLGAAGVNNGSGTQSGFYLDSLNHYGTSAGIGGKAVSTRNFFAISSNSISLNKSVYLISGSSGGSNTTDAAGGAGGGAMIIESGGALNFAAAFTIDASGQAGPAVSAGQPGTGGGAGGFVVMLYNTLTANAGTINTNGGNGGAASGAANGAGGGALLVAGGDSGGAGPGVAGGNDVGTGGAGGTGVGAGGGGAGGVSLVAQNNYFA